MHDIIIEFIARGGYVGIALLMALENVFPPIPSEVIMGIGGMLVARGEMEFWPLMLAGTVGSTVGNYFWFWLGDKWGYERMKPFVDRWGRWLTVDWEHVERGSEFFRRHGQWVVLVLRWVPIFRTIISLPAGLAHMKVWRFLAFTFVGTAVWNVLLVAGGTAVGRYLDEYEHVVGWIIVGFVVLTVVGYLWRVFTWTPREERND